MIFYISSSKKIITGRVLIEVKDQADEKYVLNMNQVIAIKKIETVCCIYTVIIEKGETKIIYTNETLKARKIELEQMMGR